uniref:Protein AAR2 homolog n=1 Tax=Panagrolaimus sp. JU765 TaxID=591449 RepID=A0AC34Q0U8_9BILA
MIPFRSSVLRAKNLETIFRKFGTDKPTNPRITYDLAEVFEKFEHSIKTEIRADLHSFRNEIGGQMSGIRDEMAGLKVEMTGLKVEMTGLEGKMSRMRSRKNDWEFLIVPIALIAGAAVGSVVYDCLKISQPTSHFQQQLILRSAYPYYVSSFSIMLGVILFSYIFLNQKEAPKTTPTAAAKTRKNKISGTNAWFDLQMDVEAIKRAMSHGEMPQELARKLFNECGFLVIQDCPPKLEFGVDYKSWTITEKFMGLKLIPPGIHYFFLASGTAPRIGFFKVFKGNEILLLKWDKKEETFVEKLASEDEIERLRTNLQNLDRNLAAFPFDSTQNWISLTNHIKEATIERLKPKNLLGLITGQPETESKEEELAKELGKEKVFNVNRENPERTRFRDPNGLPILKVKPGFEIPFTEIPDVPFTEESKFRAGIDNTDRLNLFAKKLGNDFSEVLAEFQYSFVVFLIGQVYDGFEQWKRLIHLFCSCRGALITQPKFFLDLLMVLFFQIKLCPDDFFDDVLSKDNFLSSTLSWFFANVQDSPSFLNPELRTKTAKVKAFFEKKFKKSFDLPDD